MEKNIYTQEYIKDLVARAAKADPEYKVFGASSHKYQLYPPVSLEKVRALEKKFQIKLPENYVYFLTQISNGGAGPYYGLYPLEELERRQECEIENDMWEPFINKDLTKEKWNEAVDIMENGDDDQYDKVHQQITTGAFIIGTQGCTYDHLLLCEGSEKGKIVYIDWNLDYDYPPFLTKMSFWDWYIGFFEDIIAGYSTSSYGYCKRGTEEELRKAYHGILTLYTGTESNVIVPEGVKAIGGLAFSSFTNQPLLTSITLPCTLKRLCPKAFRRCTALSAIEIPKSVIQIDCCTFKDCYGLTEITIPDGIDCLEESVFAGCNNLISAHIPNSVKRIKEKAFSGCISLEKPELAEDVTELGSYAFYQCRSLKQFIVPKGVTKIEYATFRYCKGLKDIVIPESVRKIEHFAFSDCDKLTDIVIPDGVITIGQQVFSYGPYYRTVSIPASTTYIHSSVFYNDNEDYIYDGMYNGITIIAPPDSYGVQFAKENELKCISKREKSKKEYIPEEDEENVQNETTPINITQITVKSEEWADQHDELWDMLVPASGKCSTVQGEVVRIGGKIHNEIMQNAGGNWDTDYMKMLASISKYYLMGQIHDKKEYKEVIELIQSIDWNSTGEDILRLIELNVHWVLANPVPIPLGKVTYRR